MWFLPPHVVLAPLVFTVSLQTIRMPLPGDSPESSALRCRCSGMPYPPQKPGYRVWGMELPFGQMGDS